ncbi:hypothetical protein HYS31_03580 [Candidatus Woesearchaeota archaeon]|nr:hypothetical protein [Candidatus Woesearchaeota archaeon]
MESIKIAKKLEGLNTLKIVQQKLSVRKSTAIKMLSILRKDGFVETAGGGKKPRLYKISPVRIAGKEHLGIYDIINKYSKIKLWEPYYHKVMDRKLEVEEALPMAVADGNFRLALASLGLFNFIKSWSKLAYYSKKYNVARKVGALYDVAKTIMRVKRMDKRTRNALMKSKIKSKHIVKYARTKDFNSLEKIWNVHIPFNKSDLTRYKE